MVGGVIRWFVDNKKKYDSDKARKDGSDRGVLYAAGMIAGEGIVGILLAVLAVFNVADKIDLLPYMEELLKRLATGWFSSVYSITCYTILLHKK